MRTKTIIFRSISIIFGILVFIDGLLNIFRGNDQGLGVAFILASTVYFYPVENLVHQLTGIRLHYSLKIILALFIIWITLAVGAINEGYYPEILNTTPS